MSADRKAKWAKDRQRIITIHDGTRLTQGLVDMLGAFVAEADRIAETEPEGWQRSGVRERLTPRLVARSDGVALYVTDRRLA